MRTLETVDRALQLLLAFDSDEDGELTVAALAARLGIHRSSASRLAGTLAQSGFLERAPGGDAFRLGPAVGRLGLRALGARNLVDASRAIMDALADESGETVVLSILEGGEAVDIAQADGPHLVGVRNWIGRRSPLHASSDGKVLIAFAGARAAGRLRALTDSTIVDRAALEREVALVRERGWASVESELEPGLNGVAAPVVDRTGACAAALSVSGPAYRLPADRLHAIATSVTAAASAISAQLGAPVAPRG
jgi:DNA-binding IclR family transcriptional regulator